MCLYTKNIEGEVSKEPIKCYKVYDRTSDGRVASYFVGKEYDLREGDVVYAEGEKSCVEKEDGWKLSRGFIHAYTEKDKFKVLGGTYLAAAMSGILALFQTPKNDRLEEFIEWASVTINDLKKVADTKLDIWLDIAMYGLMDLCLCEMEIPAGEKYWLGEDGGDICAERMLFKKEIKLNRSGYLEFLYDCFESTTTPDERQRLWKKVIQEYKDKGE